MINIRYFSNAHAIAATLPSIDAYLRSTSVLNLLPANIRHRLNGQNIGASRLCIDNVFVGVENPFLLYSRPEQDMLFDFCQMSLHLYDDDLYEVLEGVFKAPVPCKMGVLFYEIAKR